MAVQKHFCVIAQARSGSTLLRHALNAHPQLSCHGEVLSRKWINGLIPTDNPSIDRSPKPVVEKLMKGRDRDIGSFLNEHVLAIDSPCVGFKIVYEDLYKSDTSEAIINYLKSNNILIIHLVRLNSLRAYVSLLRMSKFGVTHSDSHKKSVQSESIEVDIMKFLSYKSKQGEYQDLTNSLFEHQIFTQINYEDIEDGYNNVIDGLGLPPHKMEKKLARVGVVDMSKYVSNYASLATYDLRENKY